MLDYSSTIFCFLLSCSVCITFVQTNVSVLHSVLFSTYIFLCPVWKTPAQHILSTKFTLLGFDEIRCDRMKTTVELEANDVALGFLDVLRRNTNRRLMLIKNTTAVYPGFS